ncbi:sulfurtransferase [Natrinema sp. 1APR25-10V2]|uniref:sulfurtransferase n=1 Tax=Natrinema sp. 1APR25-10V2 TaxID=2951081 RepID=UPI0028744555|nr:sulfurtransferase [Natrinema sp. 1APR25-10V2]MDS0477882.1 sulfurtransferase [Natrinema sp. 1APR25-10V2]
MDSSGRASRRAVLGGIGAVVGGLSLAGCLRTTRETGTEPELYTTPAAGEFDAVVDSMWLSDNLDGVDLLDVRDEGAFTDGHIAGARRFPDTALLEVHYEETPDGYEASPGVIATAVADAGITADDDVIVYGEGSNLWETYAIYTLRAIGHDGTVALLDGGYPVWADAGGETETGTPEPTSATYEPELQMDVIATRERVAANVREDGADVQLVDNRTPAEYFGVQRDDGVSRYGHITGAINIEFTQNLVDDGARLRSPADLETLWLEDAGLDPTEETISYCSTAVRGSVGWFVMEQLGWDTVRNYEGSWADWGTLSEADGYYYTTGEGTGTVIDTFA